jgi:hypothetical protein
MSKTRKMSKTTSKEILHNYCFRFCLLILLFLLVCLNNYSDFDNGRFVGGEETNDQLCANHVPLVL